MKNSVFWDVAPCVPCENRLIPLPARDISSSLKMEAIRFSETSVYNKPTRRHIPKDDILQHFSYFDPDYLTFSSSVSGLSEDLLWWREEKKGSMITFMCIQKDARGAGGSHLGSYLADWDRSESKAPSCTEMPSLAYHCLAPRYEGSRYRIPLSFSPSYNSAPTATLKCGTLRG
jgi:hypothetical protein